MEVKARSTLTAKYTKFYDEKFEKEQQTKQFLQALQKKQQESKKIYNDKLEKERSQKNKRDQEYKQLIQQQKQQRHILLQENQKRKERESKQLREIREKNQRDFQQFYKEFRKIKPLFVIKEEEHKQKLLEPKTKEEEILMQQRKNMRTPMDIESINKHMKEYMKNRKDHSKIQLQNIDYDLGNYWKGNCHQNVKEEFRSQKENKIQKEKEIKNKFRIIQNQFGKFAMQKFKPKIDQKFRQEVQDRKQNSFLSSNGKMMKKIDDNNHKSLQNLD